MAEQIVGKVSDFKDDLIRVFKVGDEDVAVVLHEGKFHAFSGHCSHSGYSFDWSLIRPGDMIVCSSHFSFFELATGVPVSGPATEPLAIYEARVEGEDVVVVTDGASG